MVKVARASVRAAAVSSLAAAFILFVAFAVVLA